MLRPLRGGPAPPGVLSGDVMNSNETKTPRILLISPRFRFILAVFGTVAMVLTGVMATPSFAGEACGPDSNPIACENSKPGSPWQEWEIEGAGDDSIQGFATDISVNVGERIDFKIDTDASDYNITIYRTGWYQGLGAREIDTVTPSAALPQQQPECLTDVSTELTDCGTWDVSASWEVPADAVSGVYLAKLERPDTGADSHITFVVRDESSHSDVLFQTSDPTWHAYNLYGGSDFYAGGDNGRAYKISYNRPFATRAGVEARDFYFGAEYPLVRFLERNGYDVSYFSGVDTDRHGQLLKNHKTFLSVGHDEYWSGQQRANIEQARDAGVNLQFLTGNEAYWRTRYEPSPTGGEEYRTLVSYKETWSYAKLDPSPEWTGTWRDPRYASQENGAGLPENELTGTAYVVNNGDLPVTVDEREGKLRLWRDTPLTNLESGQSEELAPHTVGYESNEDLDNGFRPPGLIHLSTTTGDVPEYLQDFGNDVLPGHTTHHTTLYRAPSGALVFSAGSIQWTWGLDQWHDGAGAEADPRMQQAQVNLLADMGAQPQTLMDGLTQATASTDTVPPTLEVTQAPDTEVKSSEQITVSGTAQDAEGQVAGVEYSTDQGNTWHPATGTTQWTFTTVVRGSGELPVLVRAIDDSANYPVEATGVPVQLEGPYTVFGAQVPQTPDAGDTSAAELGLRFTATTDGYVSGVRFYKSKDNGGQHTGTLWSATGEKLATTTFTEETETGWQQTKFDHPVEVSAGTEYVVSYYAPKGHYASQTQAFSYTGLDAGPVSVAGGFGTASPGVYDTNGDFPAGSWNRSHYFVDVLFETVDSIAPMAFGHTPANTALSVPTSTPIGATLSKPAQAEGISIELVGEDGSMVPGQTHYDAATRYVGFTPEIALAEGLRYTATLRAQDLAGNPVSEGASWNFRTVLPDPADPNDCPCGLFTDATPPTQAAVSDGTPVTLGTRFSTETNGKIIGIEFYRSPGESGPHPGWLYTGDGQRLAELIFPDDSVSGWQFAAFESPVAVQAGKEYVAAYRSNGIYPVSPGELSEALSVGPLRTSASSGHYSYDSGFPANKVNTNYLVDVRFEADPPGLAVTEQTPAPGSTNAALDTEISVTFNAPVADGATLTATVADGTTLEGTTQRSAGGKTLVFRPAAELPAAALVTITPTAIAPEEGGTTMSIDPWSFRTAGEPTEEEPEDCPCGLFPSSLQPEVPVVHDGSAVTLGTEFSAESPGVIQGLEFYLAEGETGPHTGWLYSDTGQVLAEVQFANTGVPGWQYAAFETPVMIEAGANYVAAYRSNGKYPVTTSGLAEPAERGPLRTSQNAGRYSYSGAVPDRVSSSNYLVDVRFLPETDPLRLLSQSPAPGTTAVATDAIVSATFNKALAEGSTMTVQHNGSSVQGTSTLSEDGKTLSFTPHEPLPEGSFMTVQLKDIAGAESGQLTVPAWSFGTVGTTQSADPYDCPCGIFPPSAVPDVASVIDGREVTLGTSFEVEADGKIEGLEFYRSPDETGPVSAWLYSDDGQVLAQAQFPDVRVAGWHYAQFDTPVQVQGGTTYVTAYRSNTAYTVSPGALSEAATSGYLHTASSAGRYTYGSGAPGQQTSSAYLIDVRYTPEAPDLRVTGQSPEAGARDVALDAAVSMEFNTPVPQNASLSLSTEEGPIPGSVSRASEGRKLVFAAADALPPGTRVTVTPQGLTGADGTALAPWSFRTANPGLVTNSFLGQEEPQGLDPNDNAAVELGMRLKTAEHISVHAIRYYQGPLGSGAKSGTIWDEQGRALATVDFAASSGTGWRIAYLEDPLDLSAGTTFTVAYFAPNGGYVHTQSDFAAGRTNGVLSLEGPNGLFSYGSKSQMPRDSWNNTNYFADVLYSTTEQPGPEGTEEPSAEAAEDSSPSAAPEGSQDPAPAPTRSDSAPPNTNNSEAPASESAGEESASKEPEPHEPSSSPLTAPKTSR